MAGLPAIIATSYRGSLLDHIVLMPKAEPISFETAIFLLNQKLIETFDAGQIGSNPGQYYWYINHFVEYIIELGFHIRISGDEFEFTFSKTSN